MGLFGPSGRLAASGAQDEGRRLGFVEATPKERPPAGSWPDSGHCKAEIILTTFVSTLGLVEAAGPQQCSSAAVRVCQPRAP